jgi:hypothetical protein
MGKVKVQANFDKDGYLVAKVIPPPLPKATAAIIKETTPAPPPPPIPVKKPKRIWDNYRVIGEVMKANRLKLVIGAGIRDGVRYVNIREFYYRKRDNTWCPGRDGVTVPLIYPTKNGMERIAPYNDFMKLLQLTAETVTSMPLADENNAIYKK